MDKDSADLWAEFDALTWAERTAEALSVETYGQSGMVGWHEVPGYGAIFCISPTEYVAYFKLKRSRFRIVTTRTRKPKQSRAPGIGFASTYRMAPQRTRASTLTRTQKRAWRLRTSPWRQPESLGRFLGARPARAPWWWPRRARSPQWKG